jgi:hypothetical protein
VGKSTKLLTRGLFFPWETSRRPTESRVVFRTWILWGYLWVACGNENLCGLRPSYFFGWQFRVCNFPPSLLRAVTPSRPPCASALLDVLFCVDSSSSTRSHQSPVPQTSHCRVVVDLVSQFPAARPTPLSNPPRHCLRFEVDSTYCVLRKVSACSSSNRTPPSFFTPSGSRISAVWVVHCSNPCVLIQV